jgi:membrane-anchored protein YejM (alkaline phosphatase superfamily)
MSNNVYILALAVAIIFLLCKLIELKYIDKEGNITFKTIIRDTVIVYFSVVGGHFIIHQIMPADFSAAKATQVFTDPPNF